MGNFLRYIGLCLSIAFKHNRSIIDFASTVVGILGPFTISLFSKYGVQADDNAMNALFWQIPLGLAAAFGGARILISPYWVYQDIISQKHTEIISMQERIDRFEEKSPYFARSDWQANIDVNSIVKASFLATNKKSALQGMYITKCLGSAENSPSGFAVKDLGIFQKAQPSE